MQRLGRSVVGQPGGERVVVLGGQLGHVQPAGGTVGGRQRQPGDVAGAGAPASGDVEPGELTTAVFGQPVGQCARLEHVADHLEAAGGPGLLGRQGLHQPVAQHPELQAVEDGVHRFPVPVAAFQFGDGDRQLEVADQGVQLAVADHVVEVCAQRLTGLAGNLGGATDDVLQPVVGADPFGGCLRADPGHARQVVGGLPHQRRQLGVLRGRHEVALEHRLGGHPGQVGNALARVEHGHVVGDQLQRVAVAGADQYLQALRGCLLGEGGDDVVGLEAVQLDVGDVERVEHLFDQRDLTGELGRRLRAVRLVLAVLVAAEGLPGDVEGHRQMGRLLVAQHVDQHRGEAVDRVGVLPGGGREVLHGQGEEGSVGH